MSKGFITLTSTQTKYSARPARLADAAGQFIVLIETGGNFRDLWLSNTDHYQVNFQCEQLAEILGFEYLGYKPRTEKGAFPLKYRESTS